MKIAFILGTRPEILKLAPLIKESIRRNIQTVLIHTNQHYSFEMDEIFFKELKLKKPDYNLKIGSCDHNLQIGKMLIALDATLKEEKPDVLVVQGDTNSTLAGALAASKLGIKIAHVEAGLRSYDRNMPEEINRIITDSISDFLFPVTKVQEEILSKEGINRNKIFTVGNTIVDTLIEMIQSCDESQSILLKNQISSNEYFLLTIHRPSNVDEDIPLLKIINNLEKISHTWNKKILWPIHPRTKKKIEELNLKLSDSFILTSPVGYVDFLTLMKNSFMILTDSGGIQEEACIIRKPCITLRENTERPETVSVGANILVGDSLEKLLKAIQKMQTFDPSYTPPFGDGTTSIKIMDIITK